MARDVQPPKAVALDPPSRAAGAEPSMSRLGARAERRTAWTRPVSEVRLADRHLAALGKLRIKTVGDLLWHLPFRYVDLSTTTDIASVKEGEQVTVSGTVRKMRERRTRARRSVVEVALFDGTGYVFGTWFNQPWVARQLAEGSRAVFSGRVRRAHGRLEMENIAYEVIGADDEEPPRGPHAGRIIPIYATTAGLSTTWLRRLAYEALAQFGDVSDPLPAGLRLKRALPPEAWALRQAHFPDDDAACAAAWRRLAYEELLYLQIGLAARRRHMLTEVEGVPCRWPSRLAESYAKNLPWTLTGDQKRAIDEIGHDMARPHPMTRLLYGEVGSGKTAVAATALLVAVDSGAQAAMMAPTEVLADQYAKRMGPDLDKLGVQWELLLGSTKAAAKKRMLAGLESGQVSIVFGTHALIEETVGFARLGLAVVDEQHRFGVRQRMALAEKGGAETPAPHVLVMSATPIPRTLAMTLYGDLDVSVLKERPLGDVGERVTTKVCDRSHRTWAYDLVRSEVGKGRQAFIVCPIIDPSDKLEVRSVTREVDRLKDKEFWGIRLGVLHGRMSAEDKEAAMDRFAGGELDVLVATTVIEVGVDVPNATVMLVEDAERFGLAQLHQLRGRVGRGDAPAWCLLFADPATQQGKARMEAMEKSSDGFELAELDLKIRGPGEVLGPRQSGLPTLTIARLDRDVESLSWAREDAQAIVEEDPRLTQPLHAALALEVLERFEGHLDWLRA